MKKLCHLYNNILIVSILLIVFGPPGAVAHCSHFTGMHVHVPPEILALSGSCVDIRCRFDTVPEFNSTKTTYGIWMKYTKKYKNVEESQIYYNSSGSMNTHKMEIIGELWRKNCTTRIFDVTPFHTDLYMFRIENEGMNATYCEDFFMLRVVDSPWNHTLDVYGSNLKEHQSVTVSCSAFTPCVHSPPELTWNLKRDSIRQILTNTDGNITTKIQENITLTYRHDGYKINCSARYPVTGGFKQSPESVKTLSVSHSPKETRASISPSGLVSVGTLLELSCSSRAKPPISRFSWFKNSKDGVTKVSEVQVHRFTATPTDEGDYYCEVTNSLGSETSRSVCVDIFDAPFIPSINIPVGEWKEDQSVTITCSVSTPCPQSQPGLTWNLKQDSLRQTEKNTEGTFTTKIQETITLSDKHDGYIISCSARHPGDKKGKTAKTEVTLTVSYAPKNTSASISPSSLLSEGNWVELICSSRANPPSRFSWFKKGPEKFSKISTGIILRVKFTGGNEYYCEAENELGKQRSSPITFRSQGTTGSLIYVLLGVVGMAALGIIGFVLNKWYKQTS